MFILQATEPDNVDRLIACVRQAQPLFSVSRSLLHKYVFNMTVENNNSDSNHFNVKMSKVWVILGLKLLLTNKQT